MKALKVKYLIWMLMKLILLGVENILSNSLDVNAFDDFYAEKNFMFKSEEIVDPFWVNINAHEREKMCDNCLKLELFESNMKSFQVDHRSLVVISELLFLVGCYIILLLKRTGWNGLIGHLKDRGKNHLNYCRPILSVFC
jgi:hypothetical protein